MNTHELTLAIQLTDEDIDNMMSTALEGGVNHWVFEMVYPKDDDYKGAVWSSQALSKGATLLFVDEDGAHELTLAKFLEGYQKWAVWRLKHHGSLPDVDCIDAEHADCIVQFALFDDIIYG